MVADYKVSERGRVGLAKDTLLYSDLSYKIQGSFYDVYNDLGPARKEQVYHESLKIAFEGKKIVFESKQELNNICDNPRVIRDYPR
ncbi:MAG: hypothetical protein A3C36_04695 [Omnitrophica WOR_2 bacterium RIFCSPHIGHO2_02_FULL_52_10]|nr:MAG: hypothetical protein A3C36_04695 [Omnitrophica WOR_2 bacterium RIFCSPHIGHO2_02_FULL_52_10]